ncbi:hypothetical protein D3C75_364040 [compost metagenome]
MATIGGPNLHISNVPFMNLGRPVNGGISDQYSDVRLRIGIIDNPTTTRNSNTKFDPLKSNSAVNLSSGKVSIRWLEYDGGLIRPPEFSTKGGDDYDDFSDREMLSLTHPIMWNDEVNWMGINYLPPVGSVVVVGYRKNNLPVILGFLQQHYQVCEPLKLGELMIKGYGQNSSHWKQDNEQEHKAWIIEGEKDGFGKESSDTVVLKIRLKAAASKDDDTSDDVNNPKDRANKKGLIDLVAYRVSGGKHIAASAIEIKPESIGFMSYVPEDGVAENKLKTFNKIELTKDALNFSSSDNGASSGVQMSKDSIGFSSKTSSSSSSQEQGSNVQIGKDSMTFSSVNENGDTVISVDTGSVLLKSKDSKGESRINLDLGKVELYSSRINQVTNKIAVNQIKIEGNDALISVAGDVNVVADGNLNLNSKGKVNINGDSGIKLSGSRIDFN